MNQIQNINPEQIKFVIMGIGGAGIRILNKLSAPNGSPVSCAAESVELVGMDSDLQSLQLCRASRLLQLSGGYGQSGTNADPALGESLAVNNAPKIYAELTGVYMLVLVCGLGGGIGTGASCVVAEIAKSMGITTAVIVTAPFYSEERTRFLNALNGLERLKAAADSITIVPNGKSLENTDWNAADLNFVQKADYAVCRMVRSIVTTVHEPSIINLDNMDFVNITGGTGITYIGVGEGRGANKALEAAAEAVGNPWQQACLHNADRALVFITGDISLSDLTTVTDYVQSRIAADANLILGAHIPSDLPEHCDVFLFAACSEDPLDILLQSRKGQCLACWSTDPTPGWRRGFFASFCDLWGGDCHFS